MLKKYTTGQLSIAASQQVNEKEYWSNRFSKIQYLSSFPSTEGASNEKFEVLRKSISNKDFEPIKNLCGKFEQRLFITLCVSMSTLLNKYSYQKNVILGCPILEDTISSSDINNVLPLLIEVEEDSTFREQLKKMTGSFSEAVKFQNYPMSILSQQLGASNSSLESRLFNVGIVLKNIQNEEHLDSLSLPQTWVFERKEDSINIEVKYDSGLYESEFIEHLLHYFQSILTYLAKNLDNKPQQLSLVTQESLAGITNLQKNEGLGENEEKESLIKLLNNQAQYMPHRELIEHAGKVYTINSLYGSALNLVKTIEKQKKVSSGETIGILLDSPDKFLIAYLATLLCQCNCSILDSRIQYNKKSNYLNNHSRIITESKYLTTFEQSDVPICNFEGASTKSNTISLLNEETNSTTVFIPQINTGEMIEITEDDISLFHGSSDSGTYNSMKNIMLSESISKVMLILEFWNAIKNELFIYLNCTEESNNVTKLKKIIDSKSISYFHIDSSSVYQFFKTNISIFSPLKQLVISGQPVSRNLLTEVSESLPDIKVTTYQHLSKKHWMSSTLKSSNTNEKISFNTTIFRKDLIILDQFKNLSLVGAIGDIYVALSRHEYIDDLKEDVLYIDEDNKKFIKTESQGQYLLNRTIQFQGVYISKNNEKHNFFDIENYLLEIDSITDCYVTKKKNNDDDSFIVCAYVVGCKPHMENNIKTILTDKFPNHDLPDLYIFIKKIPRDGQGVVIDNILSDLERTNFFNNAKPETKIEIYLQQAWSKLLVQDKDLISTCVNFFDLGGQSLKAMALVSLIKKDLGLDLPLYDFFINPTIGASAEFLDKLESKSTLTIPKSSLKERYKISSNQKRIYLLQRMKPNSKAYNIPFAFEWHGSLDVSKIEHVFENILNRHEILRTSFDRTGNEIFQIIHEKPKFQINYKKGLPSNIDTFIDELSSPFDLDVPPLMRVGILEVKDQQFILVVVFHHTVIDGVSIGILAKEIKAAFSGEKLPKLEIQYKDFSEWQNSEIFINELAQSQQFWLQEFSTEPPVLMLPNDKNRPKIQSFNGNTLQFELNEKQLSELHLLSTQLNSTLYITLLTIINVWLHKLTLQEDIVVGSPIAGRKASELNDVIGMFVNTLALRNHPTPHESFINFLEKVKQKTLRCFDSQYFPYERLVEEVQSKRSLNRNPLFDVMFALQNMGETTLDFEGVQLFPYQIKNKTAKFDINITCTEHNHKLIIDFEYNSDIFSLKKANDFIENLQELVCSILADPKKRISDLSVLPSQQKNHLLYDLNQSHVDFGAFKPFHKKIEQHAIDSPNKIAVKDSRSEITYKQLNERANQLARHLLQLNVLDSGVIGIYLDRSIERVISILAIHKVNNGYLSIDTNIPTERAQFYIEDAKLNIIITKETHNQLDGVIQIAIEDNTLEGEHHQNLDMEFCESNPAYVIYTSGSTGKPKGVLIQQGALTNFILGMNHVYENTFSIMDRGLSLTNSMFDASIIELFMPLWFGGQLIILPSQDIFDVAKIVNVLDEDKITFSWLPPALLKPVLLEISQRKIRLKLDKLFVGAESISQTVLSEFVDLLPNLTVVNGYGPTESTITASMHKFIPTKKPVNETVLIGSPTPNTRLYVVDKNMQLVPKGVVGELYIAGSGLAQSYFGKDSQDQSKFVSNFLGLEKRAYKSGDLVKWTIDNELKFIGRNDDQIKIRGVRIEPGEIENALTSVDQIKSAVALVREIPENNERVLVAYYTTSLQIDNEQVANIVRSKLPSYMMPDMFVHLIEMPILVSGKIDKKHLPIPQVKINNLHIEPINETQVLIRDCWAQVLGINAAKISINDNFFEIGGNSEKIITLMALLNQSFGNMFSAVDLFNYSTVSELSKISKKNVEVEENKLSEPEIL